MIEKRNAVNRTPIIEKPEIVPKSLRSPELDTKPIIEPEDRSALSPSGVLSPVSCGSGTDSDVGYGTSTDPIFSPPQIKKSIPSSSIPSRSQSLQADRDVPLQQDVTDELVDEFQKKFNEILYNPKKYEETPSKYFELPIIEANEDISDIDENSSSIHSSRLESDGSVSMLSDASQSSDEDYNESSNVHYSLSHKYSKLQVLIYRAMIFNPF